MALPRFTPPVSDSTEEQQRLTHIPKTTKCVTEWGMRIWNEWAAFCVAAACAASSEADHSVVTTPLLEMPVQDLAYWMGKFVLEARKEDGSEYLPKTLHALVCCFKQLYLQHHYPEVNSTCACSSVSPILALCITVLPIMVMTSSVRNYLMHTLL